MTLCSVCIIILLVETGLNEEFYQKNDEENVFSRNKSLPTETSNANNILREDENMDEERIVGGYLINISESPSYVNLLISLEKTNLCGGNLVTKKHVLTAAHCVTVVKANSGGVECTIVSPSSVTVRVGSSYLRSGGTVHQAADVDVHPDFLSDPHITTYKDVAIITLTEDVFQDQNTQIVSIYPKIRDSDIDSLAGKTCLVSGWGKTSENGTASEHLRQVKVTLQEISVCKAYFSEGFDPGVQVCAYELGKDSCQGDSGGGLLCDGRVLAVTSWGIGCARKSPGVYARVDNALDFLNRVIQRASTSVATTVLIIILFSSTLTM